MYAQHSCMLYGLAVFGVNLILLTITVQNYITQTNSYYKGAIFCSVVCVASRQHAVKCSVQGRRVSALAHHSEIVHTDQDRCAWGLKTEKRDELLYTFSAASGHSF